MDNHSMETKIILSVVHDDPAYRKYQDSPDLVLSVKSHNDERYTVLSIDGREHMVKREDARYALQLLGAAV